MTTTAIRALTRVATLLLAGTALPAAAQTVSRVVAFGDSYADNGNAFRLAGIPFPSVYPTGRFSGGTNFVDTLSTFYRVPQVNFAIGGAQAGSGNVSAGLPGFAQQYQGFVSTGGTFQPNDILALSIGGNDARAYRLGGGSLAGAAGAAAVSATQAATGINALVGRGARTIVFLAGDVGRLPEAIGQPSATVGSAYSAAFNNSIKTTFTGLAAGGTTVAYVDLSAIGDQIARNPAAFGITDTTASCPVPACIASPDLQTRYLFYVDGVHLTSAGFDIVGRYALAQLAAPYGFRAAADLPQKTAAAFGDTLSGRLDLARGRATTTDTRPLSMFVSATGFRGKRDADAGGLAYDYDGYGVTGGIEQAAGQAVFGVAGSWSRPKADGFRGSRTDGTSWSVGGYAGLAGDALFAQGYAGYAWHDLSQQRTAVIDSVAADFDARSLIAGGRIGYLARMGGTRIGPVAGIAFARTRIDGYTETGDAAATMTVGGQRVRTLIGGAGIELRQDLAPGVTPYLRATAEKDFDGDARTLRYATTAAPTIVNRFTIDRESRDVYGAVAAGVTAAITPALAIDVSLRSSIARQQGRDGQAFAGVRLAL